MPRASKTNCNSGICTAVSPTSWQVSLFVLLLHAAYWITNPNNTYRGSRAAGSINGYGFWYRMLVSFCSTLCCVCSVL